jgi:predicted Zn-dependent peptidase
LIIRKDPHKSAERPFVGLIIVFILFLCAELIGERAPLLLELENGLKVYLYEKPDFPIVNISIGFNLGSKNESDTASGLVHLLEHYVLYRGSRSRSEDEIIKDIRRHGAYFNAHTSYDISLFEFSLLSEYLDFALENQKDILFNLRITQEKLDEEKEIIIQEINQLHDSPLKYATSLAYQNLFKSHPYEKPIHGEKKIIQAASAEQLDEFYKTYFVPSNCVMAIVGDFDSEEIENKVSHIFGQLEKKDSISLDFKKVSPLEKSVEIEKEMDVHQAYLVIGMAGPDYNHPDKYPVDVLVNILGGGLNPMLNRILRGQSNLVYSLSSSYIALKYGGAILFYFALDPKNIGVVKRKTLDFLKQTRHISFSREDIAGHSRLTAYDYLASAKSQKKLRFYQTKEEGLNIASSLVIHALLNENQSRGNTIDIIDDIDTTDLRKVAGRYLAGRRYVIVSIIPKKKK